MMWSTHMVFGVLFGLLFLYFFPMEILYSVAFLIVCMIAASIIDIDTTNSKIGRKLKMISYLFKFFFGHRGFIHSIFIPVILFVIFWYLQLPFIAFGLLIVGISHLVGYMLTKEGVAPFYPVLMFRIEGIFKTGKFAEKIFFVVICIVDFYLFFKVF